MTARAPSAESRLQQSIVRALRTILSPDVLFFAVPNGGNRDRVTGAILKAEGVLAGVADLLFFWDGRMLAIEMKASKGRQTPSQVEFAQRWTNAGGRYAVCRSLDDVLVTLEIEGFPTRVRARL